jgi:glycosyltransferase involved in cell wall biosynthesis
VEILEEYFYQAFPTKFRTEGHPGSILDSYHAGTPVLSARWDSWKDIIDDGQTGITFEFENFGEMEEKMLEIAKNPLLITSMRERCREKSKEFAPENIIKLLIDKIEGRK